MGWNAKYIVLLLFTTIVTYTGSRILERYRKRWILALMVMAELGINRAAYYKWKDHGNSQDDDLNELIAEKAEKIHAEHPGVV